MERVQFLTARNLIKEKEKYKKLVYICVAALVVTLLLFTAEVVKQEKIVRQQKESIEKLEVKAQRQEQDIKTLQAQNSELKKRIPSAQSGEEEGEDFSFYKIPQEYIRNGGGLPDEVQKIIFSLCEEYNLDYAIVLAMIETESGYKAESVSEAGAIGYMQIIPKYHEDRIEKFNGRAEDIADPKLNISVGVDYIAYLNNKYKSIDKALTAYCYGETGAREYVWGRGQQSSSYSEKVLSKAKRIREEIKTQ